MWEGGAELGEALLQLRAAGIISGGGYGHDWGKYRCGMWGG